MGPQGSTARARRLGLDRTGARPDPVYASGGFTSTPTDALEREVAGYVHAGHRRVKIKIGRPIAAAIERVLVARAAAGPGVAARLDELDVRYFEEPVSSDDLGGLRLVRDATRLEVAAGEYGYDAHYFHRMLTADAIDILQADATRCLGVTGFLQADALCDAAGLPLSAHCAPCVARSCRASGAQTDSRRERR